MLQYDCFHTIQFGSAPMYIQMFNIYFSDLLQDSKSGKKRKRHLTEERKAKKTVCYGLSTI
jgi:hypothetical protein